MFQFASPQYLYGLLLLPFLVLLFCVRNGQPAAESRVSAAGKCSNRLCPGAPPSDLW